MTPLWRVKYGEYLDYFTLYFYIAHILIIPYEAYIYLP